MKPIDSRWSPVADCCDIDAEDDDMTACGFGAATATAIRIYRDCGPNIQAEMTGQTICGPDIGRTRSPTPYCYFTGAAPPIQGRPRRGQVTYKSRAMRLAARGTGQPED